MQHRCPRPVKITGLGVLSGVERIGAGEETAYACGPAGKKVAGLGRAAAKASSATATDNDSASPVEGGFEPASPVIEIVGGSQHVLARLANGELYAWGADGLGPARIRNRPGSRRTVRPTTCSMVPEPVPANSSTWWRVAAGGEGDQLRRRGRRKRQQGDLLVRGQRLLRTARPRQRQPSPAPQRPPRSEASPRCAAYPRAAPPRSRSWRAAPAISPPPLAELLRRGAHASPGRSPSEPYKLRYRPVGTREFSENPGRQLQRRMQPAVHGPETAALRSDPEEPRRQRRPRKDQQDHRHAEVRRNAGRPTSSRAHHQRQPRDETGKLRLGQTLTVAHGAWTNSPTQFILPVAAL